LVIVHGLASIFSVLFLFFGLVTLGILTHVRGKYAVRHIFTIVVLCWGIFGAGSLLDMVIHFGGNLLQYFFISICSISVVLVVATIEYLNLKHKSGVVEYLRK